MSDKILNLFDRLIMNGHVILFLFAIWWLADFLEKRVMT